MEGLKYVDGADPYEKEDVAKIVKDYQSKGIMTFLIGDVIEQAIENGVRAGLEFRVIPLGHDVTAVIHVVTVAVRAALIFGAHERGDLPDFWNTQRTEFRHSSTRSDPLERSSCFRWRRRYRARLPGSR